MLVSKYEVATPQSTEHVQTCSQFSIQIRNRPERTHPKSQDPLPIRNDCDSDVAIGPISDNFPHALRGAVSQRDIEALNVNTLV
jgi:hypothetical protein